MGNRHELLPPSGQAKTCGNCSEKSLSVVLIAGIPQWKS